MLRAIGLYGTLAGLIVGVPMLAVSVALQGYPSARSGGALLGYSTMLLALSLVFVAIKRHRDRTQGGVIKFLPALGLGLGISAVAGVFYCLAWEAVLAVTHMDFAGDYARMMVESAKAKGLSGAALAQAIADADRFRMQYANPLYRAPMTFAEIFPMGVLVSLVSAGLLCNSRFMPAQRPGP